MILYNYFDYSIIRAIPGIAAKYLPISFDLSGVFRPIECADSNHDVHLVIAQLVVEQQIKTSPIFAILKLCPQLPLELVLVVFLDLFNAPIRTVVSIWPQHCNRKQKRLRFLQFLNHIYKLSLEFLLMAFLDLFAALNLAVVSI